MNTNNKITNTIAGILVACSAVLGILKVADIVEWDWLWITSGLWAGLIIFVIVIILNSSDKKKDYDKTVNIYRPNTDEIIGKALDEIREKNKKLKLYETGDPVKKAVNLLKQEKEGRIEREADKLNRLRGKTP